MDGDQYLLMAMDLDYPTYVDDFAFAPGYTYHFTAYVNEDGRHDSVKLEITQGEAPADAVKDITVRFVAGEHGTLTGTTEYAALSTTALRPGKTPKATADEGYVFTGWEPAYQGGVTVKGDVTYIARFEEAGDPATIVLEARGIREKLRTLLMQYYADQGLGGDTLEQYVEDSLQAQYAYAMLFDADATARSDSTFTIYQGSWTFQVSGDLSAEQMSAFEYLLPEGFDGTLTTDAMLDGTDEGGEITLKIPAGTYDVVALSRSAERGLFSSLSNVDNEDFAKGYGEYTFEAGKTYHFTVDCSLEKVKYGWETIDYPCELLRLTVTDSEPETPVTPVTPGKPAQPAEPTLPFTDVSKDDWFYAGVADVYGQGLMQGVEETLFAPDAALTRGQAVTILYRLAGTPAVSSRNPFRDVAAGSYCEDAVIWANAKGIAQGYDAVTFRPGEAISRQRFAALLYRYAKTCGQGFQGSWYFLLDYPDAARVASYADEAMHWCVTKGVIQGTADKRLAPEATVTRAQAAVMLQRFSQALKG